MQYFVIATLISAALAAPFGQGNNGFRGGNGGSSHGSSQGQQGQQGGAAQGGAAQAPAAQSGGNSAARVAVPPPLPGSTGTPTPADLATAVANWQADTSMVSAFLDNGKGITDDTAFKLAAQVAFNAEVDELSHKSIIDISNGDQAKVIAANSTLAGGGCFQDVVDKLQIMATQGRAAVNNIDLIVQNRCVNVLPNIDQYMASTGSSLQAIRPKACDQTGVKGGVQGDGPTLPGQAPGSPAAAFAAAKALANGTGNGKVDNSANAAPAAAGGAAAGGAAAGGAAAGGAAAGGAAAGGAASNAQGGSSHSSAQGGSRNSGHRGH